MIPEKDNLCNNQIKLGPIVAVLQNLMFFKLAFHSFDLLETIW